jgi:hypothetical protein
MTKTRKEPDIIERMRREGKLKTFANMDEARQAREAREQRGVKETPAYLLPDDHYRHRKRYTITLSNEAHAIAKKIGKRGSTRANVSGGIERALFHFHDCPRTDRRRAKKAVP